MFEQSFKNIDNLLRKDKGLSTEIDYVELCRADILVVIFKIS